MPSAKCLADCKRSRRYGLSLLEVLLATLLLTVCLIFVITLLISLLRTSTKGEDQTVALEVADKLLTQLAAAVRSQWADLVDDPVQLYTHDPAIPTEFRAEYQANSVKVLSMGELYDVTLSVFWWAPQSTPNRNGYGRQSVTLQRTVYVERAP